MSETNNYIDSHDTTNTTINNTSIDSHDTTTTVSLVNGGLLNGSLNNILSGNTLLNVSDVLSGNTVGDVLSNNHILSPEVNIGDVNLGVSDIVHDVLNTDVLHNVDVGDILSPTVATSLLDGATTAIGSVLSPDVGDLLSNLNATNLLNVGDVLDAGHLTANVLPVAGDLVGGANVAAPVTGILGDISGGDVGSNIGNVIAHIGDVGNVGSLIDGSIGDVVAQIASIGGGDLTSVVNLSDIGHGIAADVIGNVTAILGGNNIGSELLHSVSSVDLSDVGAVLNGHGLSDVISSNLDLDHLTSNLNLFDTAFGDAGADIHHHS